MHTTLERLSESMRDIRAHEDSRGPGAAPGRPGRAPAPPRRRPGAAPGAADGRCGPVPGLRTDDASAAALPRRERAGARTRRAPDAQKKMSVTTG